MKTRKLSSVEKRATHVLEASGKLERDLRNLRAFLLSKGWWKAIEMLDRSWLQFSSCNLARATDWLELIPDAPSPFVAGEIVIPLRLHNFTHMERPSRLKKESV